MILVLDTSTPICQLSVVQGDTVTSHDWEAGRGLADGLLSHMRAALNEHHATWSDISGLAVYKGPGSFTGLRIGLTVCNTIADTMGIPIVGETGEDWLAASLTRLSSGENDNLVMPLYGREPNITKPRK